MATLDSFTLPGKVGDDDVQSAAQRDALHAKWQEEVSRMFAAMADLDLDQLYDPRGPVDTPEGATRHPVTWFAFPARLNRKATTPEARAELADGSRDQQDEYCEWSVKRADDRAVTKVTFTSEVFEYYSALWAVDPELVVALYRKHVSPDVQRDELGGAGGYNPRNSRNLQTDGPIMHLCQGDNNLEAAVTLAAQATVLRELGGMPVTNQQDLVACGRLGNKLRSSDPQIASAINGRAALGELITLSDPLGLYIDRLETAGMRFPDGLTVADCWHVERGAPGHVVRARFELPPGKGTVSDVTIDRAPITSGAQLADHVVVRIGAVSHSRGAFTPKVEGCVPARAADVAAVPA